MDYDPNDRQSWEFTFIGGTLEIETEASESTVQQVFPLTATKVGDRVWIVGFSGEGGNSRLLSLGLIPGAAVEVVSCMGGGSIVVKFQNNRLGLGAGMANRVIVTDNPVLKNKRKEYQMNADTSIHLQDLPVGMRGRVVGYEQFGGAYKENCCQWG